MIESGDSRQQTATEILMDCQTEIKVMIKNAVLSIALGLTFMDKVEKLIDERLKDIENEELRKKSKETLINFAKNEYNILVRNLNLGSLPLIVAFSEMLVKNSINVKVAQKQLNEQIKQIGVADLNNAYSQLGNSQAKVNRSQSLYGYSEMVARYEEQQEMIDNLRRQTNLIICDTHSDCSDRCFPWQGKIYSLDGTYGKTDDGRDYQPLENATQVRDKYGNINGLLGYNCRHKLHAYKKGIKAIKVSKEEQKRENKLTMQQRLYEREIRYSKDLALSFRGVDNAKAKEYREKTTKLTTEYRKFCEENNRVFYKSRIQI